MRGAVIVMLVAALALGLVALVGCGNGKESGTAEMTGGIGSQATNAGAIVGCDMSLAGTFTRTEGSNTYRIVVKEDGTFSGNGFGDHSQEKSGTYALIDMQVGKGMVFTFSDGTQETWSIIIAEDEMRAICDAEGDQYTKQ